MGTSSVWLRYGSNGGDDTQTRMVWAKLATGTNTTPDYGGTCFPDSGGDTGAELMEINKKYQELIGITGKLTEANGNLAEIHGN